MTIEMSASGVICAHLFLRSASSTTGTYDEKSDSSVAVALWSMCAWSSDILSHHDCTYGAQPTSLSLMYSTPARETVAGLALRRCEISKMRRIAGVSGIRSLETSVSTLLSSMTVFIDSIHSASMSPSSTTHL